MGLAVIVTPPRRPSARPAAPGGRARPGTRTPATGSRPSRRTSRRPPAPRVSAPSTPSRATLSSSSAACDTRRVPNSPSTGHACSSSAAGRSLAASSADAVARPVQQDRSQAADSVGVELGQLAHDQHQLGLGAWHSASGPAARRRSSSACTRSSTACTASGRRGSTTGRAQVRHSQQLGR